MDEEWTCDSRFQRLGAVETEANFSTRLRVLQESWQAANKGQISEAGTPEHLVSIISYRGRHHDPTYIQHISNTCSHYTYTLQFCRRGRLDVILRGRSANAEPDEKGAEAEGRGDLNELLG